MMRILKARFRAGQTIGFVLGLIGLLGSALISWVNWRGKPNTVVSHSYQLVAERADQWQPIGGKWEISGGEVASESNERGAKLLTGSNTWRDYTVNADIHFDSKSADMGVVVRSNNESVGIFAFDGYYVGLRSLDDTLVVGRANYGWAEARPVPMPGGVRPSEWYHLRVTAFGCNVAASAQNLSTLQTAWIAFEERSCIQSGRMGLRSLNAQGSWRNVSISSANLSDYLHLRSRATSVEQPVIVNGPPWWNAWHIALLFAGSLTLALSIQLIYFRVQQWKAQTIMRERERLAHEVHEMMAQSFAGLSHQLETIRATLLRGNPQELGEIPYKLTVAYELVRKCHEKASKTIATLGTTPSTAP